MTTNEIMIPKLLTNKVAIVTGASRGLGAQIAKQLAASGASVCVNYLNSKTVVENVVAEIIAAGGKAFAYQGDVTSLEQMQALSAEVVNRFGKN